ncbi:GNAT family N-acetyltransferase [Streptomyces sp. XD-27]|uniref:GNAT family N-acetyltransferase n=1 Tax=Streptomyces sp. XD-27 TaxID=3062779 RepID=UPI0026F44B53|nr:GNAT family N-acetyltransferase [Streptomyces sp. XD-27]WKX71186.1 GNAT family N-acetyltransferase [Streptomyces sp. XD-27]
MGYQIRTVKADEWQQAKELRLAALADPIARIAFHETRLNASRYADDVWRDRAERSAAGTDTTTYIGETEEGVWAGMVVVLVEPSGQGEPEGADRGLDTAHLVAVYVRPEHRGTGLARQLFDAAIRWSWDLEAPRIERVRLWVHEDNVRAEGFYRKLGFVRTGVSATAPKDPSRTEFELALRRPDGGGAR